MVAAAVAADIMKADWSRTQDRQHFVGEDIQWKLTVVHFEVEEPLVGLDYMIEVDTLTSNRYALSNSKSKILHVLKYAAIEMLRMNV